MNESLRQLAWQRAAERCEYCLLRFPASCATRTRVRTSRESTRPPARPCRCFIPAAKPGKITFSGTGRPSRDRRQRPAQPSTCSPSICRYALNYDRTSLMRERFPRRIRASLGATAGLPSSAANRVRIALPDVHIQPLPGQAVHPWQCWIDGQC